MNDALKENYQNLIDTILSTRRELSDIEKKIEFDIISTQMAIHYFFESEHKLRMYLKNVSDRLRPGGYFIGTTIDSDYLVYKVRS